MTSSSIERYWFPILRLTCMDYGQERQRPGGRREETFLYLTCPLQYSTVHQTGRVDKIRKVILILFGHPEPHSYINSPSRCHYEYSKHILLASSNAREQPWIYVFPIACEKDPSRKLGPAYEFMVTFAACCTLDCQRKY